VTAERIRGGWGAAEAMADQDLAERDELLAGIEIIDIAEQLRIQVHTKGLTCPAPDHLQSGASSPCSTSWKPGDIQVFCCHGCDIGGTAIDYLIEADEVETVGEALAWLADFEPSSRAQRARRSTKPAYPPEDPHRRPAARRDAVKDFKAYFARRGWDVEVLTHALGERMRWVEDTDSGERLVQVFTDDALNSWQTKSITAGGPWRSAAGRKQKLFTFEPPFNWPPSARELEVFGLPPSPRPLIVEGASDFLTAITAQGNRGGITAYEVVALPGAGRTRLLDDRDDWCAILDNDPAGRAARERLDEEQEGVKHLYVPSRFNDLNDWWCAVRPRDRPLVAEWIHANKERDDPRFSRRVEGAIHVR
jgi:hypothetical protein